jgi:hypothetical protein
MADHIYGVRPCRATADGCALYGFQPAYIDGRSPVPCLSSFLVVLLAEKHDKSEESIGSSVYAEADEDYRSY